MPAPWRIAEPLDEEIQEYPNFRQAVMPRQVYRREGQWLDMVHVRQERDQLSLADGRPDDEIGKAYDACAF